MAGIRIVEISSYLPDGIVTNDDLSKIVDTNDEWIVSRTGISTRYFAQQESNIDMAINAARKTLDKSNISPNDICCVIVATFTPENFTPSIACEVQKALNLPESIMAFDINAACTGFVQGLKIAKGLLLQHPQQYALLIGSEKISKHLDFSDRTTAVLFGDGAGAAIVSLNEEAETFFLMGSRGDDHAIRCDIRTGGKVIMDGKEVFKFAVEVVTKSIDDILTDARLTPDDIDYIVCHQANLRIISHVYKKMGIDPEKFFINLDRYGNTSSASIPIALDEMREKGMLTRGKKIICVGFGAGLTWGAVLITW